MAKKRGKSTHLTQAQLATLEAQGIKLTESTRFTNVHYKPDENGINIYAGRCGQLQIDWNSLDDFIEELMEFQEVEEQLNKTYKKL